MKSGAGGIVGRAAKSKKSGSRGQLLSIAATAAEREEWGKQGAAQIVAIVKQMKLREAMDDLKMHDEFTNKVLVPKYGKILPGAR